MHQSFYPLTSKQYMLLITTMTMGGSESAALFQYLPEEEQKLLTEKAELLTKIPSAKRVPFMVMEMKEELKTLGQHGMEYVDPSWIVYSLKGELPRVLANLLFELPPPLVRKLVERIPGKVREHLPAKDEIETVSPELRSAVRYLFENKFHEMPRTMRRQFVFANIILLDRKDLATLIRILGLEELAQAFISVGKQALAELCRSLPREKAEELIEVVRRVDKVDLMDLKTAQRFLARVLQNFKDEEDLFRRAGIFRLSKAALLEDRPFHLAMSQRLPIEQGKIYLDYVDKAAEIAEWQEAVLKRLQNNIFDKIKALSAQALISPRYANLDFAYHQITADGAEGGAPAAEA